MGKWCRFLPRIFIKSIKQITMKTFLLFIYFIFSVVSSFAQKRHILELSNVEIKKGVYAYYEDVLYNDPYIKDTLILTPDTVKIQHPKSQLIFYKFAFSNPNSKLKRDLMNYYYDGQNYYFRQNGGLSKIYYWGLYCLYDTYVIYYFDPNSSMKNGLVSSGIAGGLIGALADEYRQKQYDKSPFRDGDKIYEKYFININDGSHYQVLYSTVKTFIREDKDLLLSLEKLSETEKVNPNVLEKFLIQYSEKHKDEIKLKKIH